MIKEAHGEGGTFCNVNPSKENWVSGFLGIRGFSINCIANYDLARVDLYLGKPEKEENEKAYDDLIRHKSEIEEKLGVSLIWNRADDSKSSKISYQLNGVSIKNEADWFQMAKFHAEWSKRFCDPNNYYMVCSVPLNVDLTELTHYPSIAITKDDLE